MPTERIYPLHCDPAINPDVEPRHLHIGWLRDHEEVSLAGVVDDPEGRLPESPHITFTSRAQVNRVIRILKTARDQAFGKDE